MQTKICLEVAMLILFEPDVTETFQFLIAMSTGVIARYTDI